MKIVNMTPHTLHLQLPSGEMMEIEPSGQVPRVQQTETALEGYDGLPLPVIRVEYGLADELPEEQPGVYYVTSALYAQCVPHRRDVLIPARMVRDEKGRIVGCTALARVSESFDKPERVK